MGDAISDMGYVSFDDSAPEGFIDRVKDAIEDDGLHTHWHKDPHGPGAVLVIGEKDGETYTETYTWDSGIRHVDPDDYVEVTFHPQAWRNDYAISVDPEGPTTFEVPRADTLDEDGNPLPDNSAESDALRYHPLAPEWMKNWSGPYYVTVRR